MKPKILPSGQSTGYSFGWYVDTDFSDEVVIHHPGSAPGYSSHLLLYPNKDVVIAYLTNTGINTFFDKSFADAHAQRFVHFIFENEEHLKNTNWDNITKLYPVLMRQNTKEKGRHLG